MAVLLSKEWGYKMQERKLKYAAPYVFMVLPALILFVVFFIIPLIYTVTYSFFNWTNYSADTGGWYSVDRNPQLSSVCDNDCVIAEFDFPAGFRAA